MKKPNLGIMRVMVIKTPRSAVAASAAGTGLADALFTTTQQRLLGLLFGQVDRSFYAGELIALTGSGSGAMQRELARLTGSGLIVASVVGRQKHYRANADSPIFAELHGIVIKTIGLVEPLRRALRPVETRIRAAFVYGSIARKRDTASSDIDLMIVSEDLGYPDIFEALEDVRARLGRELNPTIYSKHEWTERAGHDDGFVKRVLAMPRIWLIGDEDALAAA